MALKIKTLATVIALTIAAAPGAIAMQAELNALTGSVYNTLNSMQMSLAEIDDLTLSEIRAINQVMSSGDTESEKRNKINNILRKAGNR